jgi:hypothetical protein
MPAQIIKVSDQEIIRIMTLVLHNHNRKRHVFVKLRQNLCKRDQSAG